MKDRLFGPGGSFFRPQTGPAGPVMLGLEGTARPSWELALRARQLVGARRAPVKVGDL
jgi:hypothetical protein